MSLLDSLLRKRGELKPSETQVTTPGGLVFTERFTTDGSTVSTTPSKPVGSFGFVVDMKPDMEIAWVLPNLAMGSQDVAQDLELLSSNLFTHVLSVGIVIPALEQCARLKNLYVELLDLPETKLTDALNSCFEFMDEGQTLGRIFVHCNAGVSRSASVVLAYLMRNGQTYIEAYDHLKSRRNAIRPNEGFVKQLKDLEQQYQVKPQQME